MSSIQSNTLDAVETPQTSTDTHTQNLDIDPVNTLPIQINDNDLLGSLRGNGTANSGSRIPTFNGKHPEKFTYFLHKLDHYLMINSLYSVIDDETYDKKYNLALYLHISSCLDGEAFQHVCANANKDGRLAYKLLCEKYHGNRTAQRSKAYLSLSTLKQKENENISSYITRCDTIIEVMKTFNCISDPYYYVQCALEGLLPKFGIFKSVIISHEDYPTWDQFKVRIQNFAQLNKVEEPTQIMTVSADTTKMPIVKKKQNNNFKKFLKNKNQYEPNMYCTYCDAYSHWSNDCKHKSWILATGGLRGARGNHGRGSSYRGNQTRGRGRGGRGYDNRAHPIGRGSGRQNQHRGGAAGTDTGSGYQGAARGYNKHYRGQQNNPRHNAQGYGHSANHITYGQQDYQANAVVYEYPQHQNQFQ